MDCLSQRGRGKGGREGAGFGQREGSGADEGMQYNGMHQESKVEASCVCARTTFDSHPTVTVKQDRKLVLPILFGGSF